MQKEFYYEKSRIFFLNLMACLPLAVCRSTGIMMKSYHTNLKKLVWIFLRSYKFYLICGIIQGDPIHTQEKMI